MIPWILPATARPLVGNLREHPPNRRPAGAPPFWLLTGSWIQIAPDLVIAPD